MDGLLGNLFGIEEEDPLLAMLPPEQRARLQQQARGQGMTNLGLALLQAGGPSRTPTGIGSRLGQAGMQAMQANQGVMDRGLERLMAARKMQQEQEQVKRREQFRQAIPGLFTTQTVTPPVVDAQGRPGAGEVRPPVTTTGFDQDAAMRLAMEYPELAKDYFSGISSVRDMFKTERKTATVGNTIVDVNTGDVIYTAPTEKKARTIKEVDRGNVIELVDSSTGETIRTIPKGLAPQAPRAPSDVSYKTETDQSGRLVYVPQRPGLPVLDSSGKPVTDYKPTLTAQEVKAKERIEGPQKVVDLLQEAKKYIPVATGSYVGAARDVVGNVVGISPQGQQAIQRLKGIEAALVLNMPRLEGPQSNYDQQLYREAAGKIADPTLPEDAKMAALETIQDINVKYGGAKKPEETPEEQKKKGSTGGSLPTGVTVRKVR
jgi:hypothetical protein